MKRIEFSYQPLSSIKPYANNAKLHPEKQIKGLSKSIKDFNFLIPIVIDKDNVIIAGHGRYMAAKELGLIEVPCALGSHLTDEQVNGYRIIDNKLAETGYDDGKLFAELDAMPDFDFSLYGVDFPEIEKLPEYEGDPDEVPEPPLEPVTKLGDLWLLGKHRLLCGDSTSIDAVDRLMAGEKADMVFTDPPYNVAFNGRSGKHDVIKNDDLTDSEFTSFIGDIASIITTIGAPYYVWCNWKFYGLLQSLLPFTACIVWAKNNFGMGVGYRHQHEFCLTNAVIDKTIKNESDLWSVAKDSNYVHPTQKPVELAERAIGNHKAATNILDLFGGSGSTLVACEKTNRKCYMMELAPNYCDVIIKRWEKFANNKAILESNGKTFEEINNG